MVIRKNICDGSRNPSTVVPSSTTHKPIAPTTQDPCIAEVWETLPNGEVVVVRKNICDVHGATPTAEASTTKAPVVEPDIGADEDCISDVWETLPNGEVVVIRKNVCNVDVEIEEVFETECTDTVEVIFLHHFCHNFQESFHIFNALVMKK